MIQSGNFPNLTKSATPSSGSRARLPCWADCGLGFATIPDILTPLEGNKCTSGVGRVALHSMVAAQPYSQDILFHPLLQEISTGIDVERKYGVDVHHFVCPSIACPLSFRTLTELFQHANEEEASEWSAVASDCDCMSRGGKILRRLVKALSYRATHGLL